jgi:uncharacterized protein YgiM (DUF1202 family)
VRLWLNNELRIDQWHSQTSLAHSAELDVTSPLSVKLEYYDEIGLAEARLTWERLDGGAVPAPAALPANQAPSGSMPGQDNTPTATVINANHLNVRSGPGMGYEPFTHLSHNDEVTMLARDAAAAWIQIRLPDGAVGWVASGFLLSPIPKVSLPVAN